MVENSQNQFNRSLRKKNTSEERKQIACPKTKRDTSSENERIL